jgi:hypothetical protein
MWQLVILMRVCIVIFFTHLLYGSHFYSIKKKMPTFSNKKPSTSLGRKLRIKSTLVRLLSEHEQKEQQPQEHSSSLTNHLISDSNSDENDALMESISTTQSPLPYYHVEHEDDETDIPFSNDDCDSSLDSYDSFQMMQSDHIHDTEEDEEDDDLAEAMLGSPVTEDFSVPFDGNRDVSTTPEPTQEYPSHDDDLDLDASEMAMLDLLVLCDSSGARRGFYDDLLTLLRRHVKKGFVISKAKRQDSFLSDMRKKVPTPQPRTTIVCGHEIVHFPLLEMLRDLLGSSKFTDVNNLCVNPSIADQFSQSHKSPSRD